MYVHTSNRMSEFSKAESTCELFMSRSVGCSAGAVSGAYKEAKRHGGAGGCLGLFPYTE